MVRALRWVALSSMACGLLACPGLKKQAADAGADAQPAADAAQAQVEASSPAAAPVNASEVTRYPDETPVANVPATLHWSVTDVRTHAAREEGTVVAALRAGTAVQKIAERRGFFLITFADPRNASRTEEGWVAEAAFLPEPPHPKHVAVKCASGKVAVALQMGEEQCVTECANDSACPSGESCSGAGPLSTAGAPGAIVSFCRGTGKAAAAGDAGTPAAHDAGPAPKPAKPLDGGK